jgi:hypothetical protein
MVHTSTTNKIRNLITRSIIMITTYKVCLEGCLAKLSIQQQAAELEIAMRTINYPCTILANKNSLEISIYDSSLDELTDKLCEACIPAYVEEDE